MSKLTVEDEKFLKRMEKFCNSKRYNYTAVGILLFMSFLGLMGGILFKSKDSFLMAIFFGTLGFTLFRELRENQKIFNIIKKLQAEQEKWKDGSEG